MSRHKEKKQNRPSVPRNDHHFRAGPPIRATKSRVWCTVAAVIKKQARVGCELFFVAWTAPLSLVQKKKNHLPAPAPPPPAPLPSPPAPPPGEDGACRERRQGRGTGQRRTSPWWGGGGVAESGRCVCAPGRFSLFSPTPPRCLPSCAPRFRPPCFRSTRHTRQVTLPTQRTAMPRGLANLLATKHSAAARVVLPLSVAAGFYYTAATGTNPLEDARAWLTGERV